MRLRNISAAIVLTAGLTWASVVHAGVFFDWVCDEPTCNGTTSSFTFSFEIEFADIAVIPNGSFIGVDGPPGNPNVLSATFTADLGTGFTLTLDDLIAGSSVLFDNDREDFFVMFNATATEVKDLLDDGEGAFLVFNGDSDDFSGSGNLLHFVEGADQSYFISFIQQATDVDSTTNIEGKLVRRVPEPTTLALIGIGLVGLGFRRCFTSA